MTFLDAVWSILSLLISFQFQCKSKIKKQALCVIIAFVSKKKKKFPYRKGYYAWNKHTSNQIQTKFLPDSNQF